MTLRYACYAGYSGQAVDSGQSTGNPVFRRFKGQGISDLGRALNGDGAIVVGLVLAWIGWTVSDTVSIDLAFGETYRYRIALVGWQDTWPVLRWVPGWIGIVLACIPVFRGSFDRSRILSCLTLAGALLALRLISFLPGLGTVVPVLSVFWSAHASWALSMGLLIFPTLPGMNRWLACRPKAIGVGLLLCFGIIYSVFAVFVARTTLLHGDEPQYLMIAQSLLHDGDIDLANTSREKVLEFHQMDVRPRRAPASPPDRIHPTHPIGLGALLLPAYWVGLAAVQHPRLACTLLVALITAFAVFLSHRWLLQQGFTPAGSLMTAFCAGLSPMLLLYSTQLYPEVFALVVTLSVLTSLSGEPQSRRLTPVILVSVLVALPMLHPRFLPLTGFLGFLVVREVWCGLDRRPIFARIGVIVALAGVSYVFYHLHYSNDIWGPFKPGNAWEANVIDVRDIPVALVGQWLDLKVGLLNNSPIFLGSLVGVAVLAMSRDRRILIAVGIYATTACVSALSIDWRFGYCFPSRFMVTALPALLVPLAYTMDRALSQSALLTFVLIFGFCVGVDANQEFLVLTESAYQGGHLIYRALDQMYPVGIHFPLLEGAPAVPWLDLATWTVGVAALAVLCRSYGWKPGLLVALVIFIVPSVAGLSHTDRIETQMAPALRRYHSGDAKPRVPSFQQSARFTLLNGASKVAEVYVARQENVRPGVVGYSGLPISSPSVYTSAIQATATSSSMGSAGGYYVITTRYTVKAQLNHQTRYSVPLDPEESDVFVRLINLCSRAVAHHFVTYREGADLQFTDATVLLNATQLRESTRSVLTSQLNLESRGGKGFIHGFTLDDLEPGFYRFDVNLDDVDRSVWLDRRSDPVMITMFEGVADLQEGYQKARAWEPMLGTAMENPVHPGVVRPSVEAYLSPFWVHVPFSDEMSINFENNRKQTWFVGITYTGQHRLVLSSVDLHRRSFASVIGGSRYVLSDRSAGSVPK